MVGGERTADDRPVLPTARRQNTGSDSRRFYRIRVVVVVVVVAARTRAVAVPSQPPADGLFLFSFSNDRTALRLRDAFRKNRIFTRALFFSRRFWHQFFYSVYFLSEFSRFI